MPDDRSYATEMHGFPDSQTAQVEPVIQKVEKQATSA